MFTALMKQLRVAMRANQSWSRRDLLAAAGSATMAGAMASCATPRRSAGGTVVIVGGGMAGLSAAYSLMQEGVECEVFEASPRFGGRMFTKRNFNAEGMFCELGGELVDSNHTALISLARKMGLELQALKTGERGLDFYHFGGRIYTDHDLVPAYASLAAVIAADAEGLTDAQGNWTDKARRLDAVRLSDYLRDARHSTPHWLVQLLDVAYVCELGLDSQEQSALNLVNYISTDTSEFSMFGDSDEAWRIRGGNDGLPHAVHQKLLAESVTMHTGHELKRIEARGDKMLLTFLSNGQLVRREAAQVICAIPFTVLRNVEGVSTLPLSALKKRAIAQMGYGANVKVMSGVKSKVWRQPAPGQHFFCNGSVVTDLPFQQAWETSRGQAGGAGILTNFIGGAAARSWNRDRLKRFPQEIAKIFPDIAGQWDGNQAVMDWPRSRFVKGSYSAPKPGQYTWMYEAAATAELEGRLQFAGEHTSLVSGGFMNGAVDSGQRAAKGMLAA